MDSAVAWPIFGIELRSPSLLLRPATDQDLVALQAATDDGVFGEGPDVFATDNAITGSMDFRLRTVRRIWRQRAEFSPERWSLDLAVEYEGNIVGLQEIRASHFAVTRQVRMGSWLSRHVLADGVATEMRQAAVSFAFDNLMASYVQSSYLVSDRRSANDAKRLGYRENGRDVLMFAVEPAELKRVTLIQEQFVRPAWNLAVSGFTDEARAFMGVGYRAPQPRADELRRSRVTERPRVD